MKKIWETGIILFSVMGFWGMIYPDLCFTEDVCAIVQESGEKIEDGEEVQKKTVSEEIINAGADKDIFTRLCEAKPEQIQYKSKLLEMLKSESRGSSDGGSKE